jgi:hypothetical protein
MVKKFTLAPGYEFVKAAGDRNIHIRKAGDNAWDIAHRMFRTIEFEIIPATESVAEENICCSCLDTARIGGGVLIEA